MNLLYYPTHMSGQVTLEHIKKHTVLYAVAVLYRFNKRTSDFEQMHENYMKLHDQCFEYISNKHSDPKSLKFSLALYKIATLFYTILTTIERMPFDGQRDIFSHEIKEMKLKVTEKINQAIDCFSYSDIPKAKRLRESQAELKDKLIHVEETIRAEVSGNPGYIDSALRAIKIIHNLQDVNRNLDLVVDNVLHIEQKLSSNSQDIGHLNMIDFIKFDQLMGTGESR